MIQLSGLQLKDEQNPSGDIEIICTGLRPGEKLFEELLIDADSQSTEHPLIFCALERSLPAEELLPLLDQLEILQKQQKLSQVLELLHVLVPEWAAQETEVRRQNFQLDLGARRLQMSWRAPWLRERLLLLVLAFCDLLVVSTIYSSSIGGGSMPGRV